MNIVIYFRCGFMIEPAIHYHKMRARKWANRLLHLIINHLSFLYQKNREWGKWGMSGEKIHKKMGIQFQITFISPKKQFCFTPNSGFLYCFRFIPSHTREHGYPKRKHKSKKNETDIALKIAPFWKIHSFFKLYGRLMIALTTW